MNFKNKKKGQIWFWILFLAFIGLTVFVALFNATLIRETFSDYIFEPLENTSSRFHNESLISSEMNTHIQSMPGNFRDFNYRVDLLFLLSILSTFISTCVVAYKTRKMNDISFLGYLFFGSEILLLLLSFVNQVIDYLFQEIYFKLFNTFQFEIPMLNYFFNNLSGICFIWFVILLIINKFDFKRDKGFDRVEE